MPPEYQLLPIVPLFHRRLAAAEFVCLHPKTLMPISEERARLVVRWVRVEIHEDNASHREKVLRLLGKLAARLHAVAGARLKAGIRGGDGEGGGCCRGNLLDNL